MLTANEEGDPSLILNRNLAPQLRAKKITQRRMGVCEEIKLPHVPDNPVTSSTNQRPLFPPSHLVPIMPPSNLPPILRNAVDHVNATVGELLVFRVPDVSAPFTFRTRFHCCYFRTLSTTPKTWILAI